MLKNRSNHWIKRSHGVFVCFSTVFCWQLRPATSILSRRKQKAEKNVNFFLFHGFLNGNSKNLPAEWNASKFEFSCYSGVRVKSLALLVRIFVRGNESIYPHTNEVLAMGKREKVRPFEPKEYFHWNNSESGRTKTSDKRKRKMKSLKKPWCDEKYFA